MWRSGDILIEDHKPHCYVTEESKNNKSANDYEHTHLLFISLPAFKFSHLEDFKTAEIMFKLKKNQSASREYPQVVSGQNKGDFTLNAFLLRSAARHGADRRRAL